MGKKDVKQKTAEKRARVAAKQSKKQVQKDKKGKLKGTGESDNEDINLESVLEEYAKQQAQFLKVTEVVCEPPSPRASSTIIASPSNGNELFVFGGEFYDGSSATFNNDLFIYLIDRGEWRKVTSPNSPLPRSGHAWCRGGNAGGIYLFGGEFSSPKQGTFYHYQDFWKFDPPSREWTKIETKGKGPPSRSGHRMTYHKNYIVLFGGFQDTSQTTKYLQDLWLYDTQRFVWHNVSLPTVTQKPDSRSSFSFLPHETGAVLYGGYSRVKASVGVSKQNKGGSQAFRAILKPMIHQDTWFLRITQPLAEATPAGPLVRWDRRKKPANTPNPARAGATMAWHKGRGIMFGGVYDVEESEEGIDSEFFDTLYAWNVDRNRFFPLTLRRPRGPLKKLPAMERTTKRGKGKADEEELLRNLAALEAKGVIDEVDLEKVDVPMKPESEAERSNEPLPMTMPQRRFNAQLAVQEDMLYIFGGTYEHGDREYTFDDMYRIDLGKLDGVKEVFRREPENWVGSDDESDEDGEDDDEFNESSDDEHMDESEMAMSASTDEVHRHETSSKVPEPEVPAIEEEASNSSLEDSRPHPRPFEALRDFYTRTSTFWQAILLDLSKHDGNSSIKELRKEAFEVAEAKWWDSREEITALEDQQDEAGIGEVVSIPNRGGDASATGRRR